MRHYNEGKDMVRSKLARRKLAAMLPAEVLEEASMRFAAEDGTEPGEWDEPISTWFRRWGGVRSLTHQA